MRTRKTFDKKIMIRTISTGVDEITCDYCNKEIVATEETGSITFYAVERECGEKDQHFCSIHCYMKGVETLFDREDEFTTFKGHMLPKEVKILSDDVRATLHSRDSIKVDNSSPIFVPLSTNIIVSRTHNCVSICQNGDMNRIYIPGAKVDPHDIDNFPKLGYNTPRAFIYWCWQELHKPAGLISYFTVLLNWYKWLDNAVGVENINIAEYLPTTKELLENVVHDHGDITYALNYYDIDYDVFQELLATKTNKVFQIDAAVRERENTK